MDNKNISNGRNYGFFSRMLLFSATLLAVFAIISSTIVGRLSAQYETAQYLKSYDLAMANLHEAFHNKLLSFHAISRKLLNEKQFDPDLCAMLTADSYDDVSPGTRNNVISLLSSFIQDDRYLRGFFIYSEVNKQLYYYSESQSFFYYADALPQDMPEITPYTGTMLDNESVNKMLKACNNTGNNEALYGMAATVYYRLSDPLGYVIPLYSTAEYETIISSYKLDASSSFSIRDFNGNVFFESFPFSKNDNPIQYSNTMVNNQYKFQVSYQIHKLITQRSSISQIIVFFAIIVTLFSFLLYYMTFYLSTKNINGILDGMKNFSIENLTYRLPIFAKKNEFTQIAEGFNDMCENLQHNVERSYIYELQQKKSDLYALQTSINPHFLYNTLEMIRNQIINSKSGEASQMILLLSKIYRTQTNTNMLVTLEDEVELCENLMILYQYRYQNFDYEFYVEDSVERYAIPKNTLQPLIENYFVHGIIASKLDNILRLNISSVQKDDKEYIELVLCNNGNTIAPESLSLLEQKLHRDIYSNQSSEGFALTNIYSRLRIVFKEDCSILVTSGNDEMNFQVTVTFPAMTLPQLQNSFAETDRVTLYKNV